MTHVSFIKLINKNKTQGLVINLFQPSVAFHVETDSPKQMTGFYMKFNAALEWTNEGLKI